MYTSYVVHSGLLTSLTTNKMRTFLPGLLIENVASDVFERTTSTDASVEMILGETRVKAHLFHERACFLQG